MRNIENDGIQQALFRRFTSWRVKKMAACISTPEEAREFVEDLHDATQTCKTHPVPSRSIVSWYKGVRLLAIVSTVAVFLLLYLAATALNLDETQSLMLVIAIGFLLGIATWSWAAVRRIRRDEARMPAAIEEANIHEAALFVQTFGAATMGGGFLIMIAGGIDALVACWMIGSMLAPNWPKIVVLVVSVAVAAGFVWLLADVTDRFSWQVRSLRAVRFFRNHRQLRPEVLERLGINKDWLRRKLSPLVDGSFSMPSAWAYIRAAGTLLVIPLLFVGLLILRIFAGPGDGNDVNLSVIVAVSAICCVIATLGATLGAWGHLLPGDAEIFTTIHRRFATPETFKLWRDSDERRLERWANTAARLLKQQLAEKRDRADPDAVASNIAVQMPFPNATVHRTATSSPGESGSETLEVQP
ncbi:MAG: hypothetical protein HY017_11595 [Betaproteobacteria bacterium]|nr:hypothetical protein [Betaproteobacteria bacterium]